MVLFAIFRNIFCAIIVRARCEIHLSRALPRVGPVSAQWALASCRVSSDLQKKFLSLSQKLLVGCLAVCLCFTGC